MNNRGCKLRDFDMVNILQISRSRICKNFNSKTNFGNMNLRYLAIDVYNNGLDSDYPNSSARYDSRNQLVSTVEDHAGSDIGEWFEYDLNGIDITKPITEPIELPIANQIETNVEIGKFQSPEIVTINIFSLSGQKLISRSGNYNNIQLPKGLYIKENVYNTGEKSINKITF